MYLNWVEISKAALAHNAQVFRKQLGSNVIFAAAVKGNAYGHGMIECVKVFLENGADFLCVNALFEAQKLRKAGIQAPILIIGYVPLADLHTAVALGFHLVVYNSETIEYLARLKQVSKIHLKIETGNHRQGIELNDLQKMLTLIKKYPQVQIVGASTHFANIEDRLNHDYALEQLRLFGQALEMIEKSGIELSYKHCANSAATLIFPESHFNFARPGVGLYGFWPSEKTRLSAERQGLNIELKPALTWKTRIIQIKDVKKGALISYGCTYEMPHKGRIAVLPTGYYDGYPRLLGNKARVLINGQYAPVVGRICMNMFMVDVTDIDGVKLEQEVVLLGKQGKNQVSAEELADWSQTINYEVTTRINERIPRIFIND